MSTKILVVGGLHGSGKSVLWKLCQSHPKIVLTDEFRNFSKLDLPYKEHTIILRKGIRDIFNEKKRYLLHDKTRFLIRLDRIASISFLIRYWMALQAYQHKLITVEVVEAILHRLFPHASIVGDVAPIYTIEKLVAIRGIKPMVMYRDCRDVAATIAWKFRYLLRQHVKPKWLQELDSAEKVARRWVQWVTMTERYAHKVYMMRYEDLVTDPQKTLRALGEWLGLDPLGFPCHIIHANNVGMHKQHLSSNDIAEIMRVAGPTMERVGYI